MDKAEEAGTIVEQLTPYQFKILRRLANSEIKAYCQPAGIDSDKRRDEITQDFNATLRLV